MEVRITGAANLRKVAAQIRATGDKGLGRELAKALNKAVDPVKRAIDASAEKAMPSGYRETLTRSLKHRRTSRTSSRQASVRLTTFAVGRKERRDLPSLEAGRLRHPVFRRTRWAVTAIEPGFHRRGTDKAADAAERELTTVLDDYAARLAKG